MFAIPEHTVLPPLQQPPLSPIALVRAVTADPRWRRMLSAGELTVGSSPVHLPWDDPRVEISLSALEPHMSSPTLVRGYDAAQGAFAVLSGQVIEHSDGRSRTLRCGQVRVFGPGYRHAVANHGDDLAVTVHVQVRPQRS